MSDPLTVFHRRAGRRAYSHGWESSGPGRRIRRVVAGVGLALTLVVMLVGLGVLLVVQRYDSAVSREVLLAPSARAEVPRVTATGPVTMLLIGSDQRIRNPAAGQRSDTIIIAHLPRSLDRVYLVSVPRDLRVDIPAMPALDFPGDTTKINAAFEYGHGGVGGVRLVSATLTDLMGIRFDGAAVIDFSGFRTAVDALGGVVICVDTPVVSVHTGTYFAPGCRLMSSAETLDYLRQREFPDGDFTRQRHQQQFLRAFLDRVHDSGALYNPAKLDTLVRTVASAMTVDTGSRSLPDLVFGLREIRPDRIIGIRLPSYGTTIDGLSYVVASREATSLFAAIQTGTLEEWVQAHPAWVNPI